MSKKILLTLFLISGFAYSQTTVTLQDQCNCEVLSGTAVTAPGAAAPTGADIGDIYVNTNTGTIYFWDGNSWELTSSDNQQLQNFSFNGGTNQLTLVLENGGSLSVDLSSLNNIGTDDQTAAEVIYDGSASGLSAGTVQLAIDEISNAANTVNLIDNTDGTYTFTKADGSTVTISDTSVSTLINNGDATFTYTSEDGSTTLIDIRDFETLTAIALNADNTNIDYTDEDGVVTQLNLSAIVDNLETVTTIVANVDGTLTYRDEDGVDTIIDISDLETLTSIALNADNTNIDYTDEDGVVTQLNLSAIVDNLETVTTIVANVDGTLTYRDEDGVDTIIDISDLETLTSISLNADDTNIDYTDEDGVVTQLNLSAIVDNLETVTTIVANVDGTLTYRDEDGVDTIIDISDLETLTSIALNADNTNIDYTDEDGVVTQLNLSAIVDNLETVTTIVANVDGTLTYRDEDGVDTIIDISDLETLTSIALNADNTNIDYTDEDGVVTQLNLSAIVDNLETVTTIVANVDGTLTYRDEDGVDTIIDISDLETLTSIALNADDTNIDYTDEDGVVTQLNLSAIVDNLETVTTIVANVDGTLTYRDEDGVDTIIDISDLETLTSIALNADNTNIDYTDEDGVVTQLNLSAIVDNLETVTTIVANVDGTLTYRDEDGVDTIIDISDLETLTSIALNADNTNIDYTDEDGVVTQLNLSAIVDNLETVTTIVANVDGTLTYRDEDGVDTIIDISDLETLTSIALNADDTNIDYTDEDGVVTQLNLSAIVDNLETVTTIVANVDGTLTYRDEDGVDTIIDISDLETLTSIALNTDNTNIDYTDEDGVVTQLNLSAIVDNLETVTTIVANVDGTLTYRDEDGVDTIIDISDLETLTSIALNADNTNIDYTDEDGVVTQLNLSAIVDNLETVTTIVANVDGTLTYRDEDGVDTIIDISDLETLTSIALNADDTNIDYTDEDGVVTQLNLSAIVDNLETVTTIVANVDGTLTYRDEDGVDTIIDISDLETLTSIALNADNTNIDYTDEDGVVTQLNLSAIVDNLETVTTIVANVDGTLTYRDEDGVDTIIDISDLETLTSIALNADNTNIDYTDEDGVVTQLNLSALVDNLETVTTLVANANGTFTYTDEDGNPTIIDVKNLETLTSIALNADDTNIDYTDEDGIVTQLNLSAIVDNLETVTTLMANANGTFTYTDEDGNPTIIDVKNLETLTTIALNADNTNIDYTDEDGVVTQLNLSAVIDNLETLTTIVANADGTFTYTDESGIPTIIDIANLETLTTVALNADNTNLEFTDEDGVVNLIDLTPLVENLETLTTMVANPGSTFTYTDEKGVATVIDIKNLETLTTILNNGDGTITYTDELGANQTITMLSADANNDIIVGADGGLYLNVASVTVAETVTNLVDNNNGTITYTNEDGTPQTVSKSDITDNLDGTYTFTNNDGSDVVINTNGVTISNLVAGNRIATITNAAGASSDLNETITTLTDNLNGTFTYTSENGTVTTFDAKIASVVDNADGTYTITDDFGVSVTVDTNNTVTTLVDNGNGSFTYTSEDGTITTFTETLSTLVDNANGTFTYTNEDGIATTFDSKIASVVDNADGTYTITDDFGVSVTVDTNNTVTTLVDNGNGSFTYTSEDGTITTFTETLSTLVDNANGTFTYTNEDGIATTFDSKIASVVDNLDGTYTITDDFGVSVTVDTNNTVTTLVDNGDGSFTYTSEDGTITTFTETLSTLVDNANGTFTYTNEDGIDTTFDSKIASVVDNLDGTYTITDDFGVSVTVDTNNTVTTLVDNGNGSFTYTSEDGTITTFTETLSTLVDNANGTFTYTNEDGIVTTFDAKRTTALDNGDGTFTITDDSGNTVNIDSNQLAGSLVNNGDGTITYTDGTGPAQTIDLISNDANNDIVVGTDGGLYLNVASVTISETITNISDTGDGTITYVNESGTTQKVNKANITDNLDGTYTFTNNDGSDVIINTNGVAISNVIAGNRIATITDAAGTVTDIDETITTLTDNGNGTFTHTSENGTITTFDAKRSTVVDNANGTYTITDDSGTSVIINTNQTTSSLVDNGNGTYTYTDETGAPQVIDTRANSNPYTPTSGLTSTDVQGALDELAASNAADNDTDATNEIQTLTSTDGSVTLTPSGNDYDLSVAVSDGSETKVTGAGINNVTGSGTTADPYIVTGTEVDGSITNEIQSMTSTDGSVTLVKTGEDYDFSVAVSDGSETKVTGAGINNVTGSGTTADPYIVTGTEVDGSITNEVNTAFGVNAGNLEITDSNSTLSVPLASLGTDDQIVTDFSMDAFNILTITLENGNTQTVDLSTLNNAGTDDQGLSLVGNTLTLEDGGTVDLTPYLDNTDNQQISFAGNILTLGNGTGADTTVDLSGYISTDDQALTLVGNILTLEDGGTVDLTPYLDNSDDQAITTFSLDNITKILTLTLEDGGTQTVDFSAVLAAADTNTTNTRLEINGSDLELEDSDGAILSVSLAALAAATDTDDQTLSIVGDQLSISEGNTVTIPTADGTETNVTAGTNVTVAGDGSIATPYVVSVATLDDADADPTNELITSANLTGTDLNIIDAGGTTTIDLSSLNNSGTDDQTLTLAAGNILTLEDGGTVDLTSFLDNTDDQLITTFSLDDTTDVLTLTLENGGTQTVDFTAVLAAAGTDDQTATEVSIADAAGNFTSTEVEGALAELAAGSSDDQAMTLAAGNILTLEDGGTVDLTSFLDNTDTQDLSIDATGKIISLVDGGSVTINADDADSDPTNEFNTGISLVGNNLTVTDAGGNQTVDISGINSDTQDLSIDATGKIISLVDGGSVTINADDADADPTNEIQNLNQVLATGNDAGAQGITNLLDPVNPQDAATKNYVDSIADDDITGVSFNSGTNTITVDEGTTTFSADLSTLSETVIGANDITVTDDGNGNYTVDYLDGDKDATNEYNTALGMNAGNLEITDNGGTLSTGMISTDANNDIAFGADGKLYLNVASVTISETITNLSDTGDGSVTYVNENGITQKVNKANITDNLDGTYTFTNNDGSDVILDTRAISNPYNNVPSGLTATNVQAAIDELAVGSTDNQTLSTSGAAGDISISNGNNISINVDDADADSTNEIQTLTSTDGSVTLVKTGDDYDFSVAAADGTETKVNAGTNVTVAGNGSIATPYVVSVATLDDADADPTNELITSANLTGTDLNIIDAGGTTTIDLSSLNNSGTDDQTLTLAAGNILTLEDGGTVDLTSFLDNTDDQLITTFSLDDTTDVLTLTLENGGTQTVDFTAVLAAAGTDDQTATEVSIADAAGNFTSTEVEGALAELAAGSSDDQTLTLAAGNILTLEDGGTVDLTSFLDNTDTQDLSIDATGKIISLVDGGSVTINADDADSDPTNEFNTGISLVGNNLTVTDAGGNQTVDISGINTDTQDLSIDATGKIISLVDGGSVTIDADDADADPTNELSDLNLAANILTLTNPATGGNQVDLSSYVNTDTQDLSIDATGKIISLVDGGSVTIDADDADADPTNELITSANLTGTDLNIIDAGGTTTIDLSSLNNSGTDDQTLTLAAGNILTLEDGGTVDLTSFLDNTDDQLITTFSLDDTTDILTLTLENGGTQTVDFTAVLAAAGTDDQTATEVSIADAAGNFTSTEVEGALAELAAGSSDDQAMTLAAGNILTLEDGGTVDLTSFLDNTDTQDLSIDATGKIISLVDGGSVTINADDADSDPTNEFNTGISLVGNNLTVTDAGGNQTVDISGINTDTQDLSIDATGKIISLVDGGSVTIDADDADADPTNEIQTLTSTDGSVTLVKTGDDYDFSVAAADGTETIVNAGTNVSVAGNGSTATPYVVSVATLDDADADPTNEFNTGISLVGSNLTVTDAGGNQTVDISGINTDTQDLSIDATGKIISLVDGGSVTIDADDADADPTNELSDLNLAANILTLTNPATGGNQVDLSSYVNTDTQDLSIDATGKIISLVDGGSVTIDADDADADPTNEIQTLTSTDGSVTLVKTGDDYDFSVAAADGTETKVNAGANVTVAGNGSIATPYVVSVATLDDADADPTNELITSANLTGTDLNIIDAGGTTTIDLSSLNNSGTDDQTLTLAAGNILTLEDGGTVDLTSFLDNTDTQDLSIDATGKIISLVDGGSVTINADDADSDPTNEFNTGISLVGNNLTVTDAGGNQTVDISGINSDTQDLSIDATGKIISLVDGGSVTIDADDADADPTNELSDLNLAANILTLSNPATGGNQVDLSSYVNTDTQDLSIDATGKIISLVDGGSVTIDADDADADPTNELITSANLTGTDLNIIDAGGTTTIDLSSLNNSGTDDQTLSIVGNNLTIESGNTIALPVADGTETKVTAGTNVTVTGAGSTASPYVVSVASLNDADSNPTNELQTISRTGSDITLSNGGGTVSINDADSVIGNETITSMTFAGSTLTVNEGGNTPKTVDLSALNTDDQKIDKFVLNGTTLELSVESDGEADKTVNLNGTFATDAELAASDAADLDKVVGNEVTNATDGTLVRSGTGTTASPYTLDVAPGGIATAELANNAVTSAKIADGTIATVDLSDNSVTTAKIVNGTIATADIASTGNNKVLTTSAAGVVEWIDKSALVPTTTVSNTSAINTLTTTVNGVTGAGVNIVNSNALSLTGSDLRSTVNGVASAALNLSSFLDNTDDQTAAEVNLVTAVDVDGDTTTETTVEQVIQDIAPIVSKAARIFYPPSIAVDASTNGTFTIDLYAQYISQYGSPTVGSAGAPAALPTYTAAELYYYVTYADPTVFNTGTMSIAADGKLTYTIIGQPSDYNSLINVVFVVK